MKEARNATPTVALRPDPGGADHRPAAEPSAFDPLDDRFETRGELGRGGMGRVADAYDRALRRPVAIKEMLATGGVELARFEREARITARLEHPGIVPIHDAGRAPDGTPFYVMRRVDGRPLDALVTADLAQRLALIPNVLAACDAVAFAHSRGVVHRDIKPTNILVGPFGETLVIDWGIAREIEAPGAPGAGTIQESEPNLTRAGTIAGTPGFMAPEQARGEAVDARADVFALGATLFYVLSGQLPYGSVAPTEMVDLAGAGREPDWRQLPREVRPELRAIAKKAMASASDARYADAGALAADLRRFITGNLVAAYDYSAVARLYRFVRRHRGAVAVAAISAVIVLVVAGLAVRRILTERDDANAERARAEAVGARLLVQRARSLADVDPVATVMALRTIGADPLAAREAWAAAEAAAVHGVPFGFATPGASYIRFSKDGTRALAAGMHSGAVTVIDVALRTSRQVATGCTDITRIAWLGPDHAVCNGTTPEIIDLRTGAARELPLHADMMWDDRDRRVWAYTSDRRLVELTETGEPRELDTGIDDAVVVDDLALALIRHGDRWSVRVGDRSGERSIDVPLRAKDALAFAGHGRIALIAGGAMHQWRVGDRLVDEGSVPSDQFMYAVLLADRTYVMTLRGMTEVAGGEAHDMLLHASRISAAGPGMLVADDKGALLFADGLGWRVLHQRATGLEIGDATADGSLVAALTSTGEVLMWDLRAAARHYRVPSGYAIVRLDGDGLWLVSVTDGLARLDLATGRLDTAIETFGTAAAFVARDESWAGTLTLDRTLLVAAHDGGKLQTAEHVEIVSNDGDGLTIAYADGRIGRWRAGAGFAPVVTLAGKADTIASTGRWIAALVGGRLVRIDALTRREESIDAPRGTSELQVDDRGVTWCLAERAVFSWQLGAGALDRLPMREPVDRLGMTEDRRSLALGSPRSVALYEGGQLHVTPVSSSRVVAIEHARAVTLNADGALRVTDLRTGVGFELPADSVDADEVDASGNRIAALTHEFVPNGQVVAVWTLDVPEQPLALEAWLGTVTNAREVPGTDTYTWPW